jgi:hypothetical protein
MNNLLIHANPGARSGFLAAFLTDTLTRVSFDAGFELRPSYFKIHKLANIDDIKLFDGIKIRIKPNLEYIDLLTLLFLRKNVYKIYPDFTRDEYSLETFSKLTRFSNAILQDDLELDYGVYDYVIDFKDTFDTDRMKEIYTKVTGKVADISMIEILEKTNIGNNISIDKNHSCSIVKLVLTQEDKLQLKEEHRKWSIVDIYKNIATDQRYDTVLKSIVANNYKFSSIL